MVSYSVAEISKPEGPGERSGSLLQTRRPTMPAYLIVDIEITDPETYKRYIEAAPASLEAYGGRYLVRGGKTEALEGDWQPKRFVVLEFESFEKAKAWWASSEYAEAKGMRQRSAVTNMVLAEGLPK
jgi:uncharacterized protein (DUF1330 family)